MSQAQMIRVALIMILFALVFLMVLLWVRSRLSRPRKRQRKDSDLIFAHRFKSSPRHRKRAAAAHAISDSPSDDSQWRRPGFTTPLDPSARPPLPIYEQGKPRHVLILHTPTVIVPHETVGPEQPRISRRNQPTVLIKTIRLDSQ